VAPDDTAQQKPNPKTFRLKQSILRILTYDGLQKLLFSTQVGQFDSTRIWAKEGVMMPPSGSVSESAADRSHQSQLDAKTESLIHLTMREHPEIPIAAFRALRRMHNGAGELLEALVDTLRARSVESRDMLQDFATRVDDLSRLITGGFLDEDQAALRMITKPQRTSDEKEILKCKISQV
jgi:hypothetical protein